MQEIALLGVGMEMDMHCAAAIWTALAVLPSLRSVQCEVVCKERGQLTMSLFDPIRKDLTPPSAASDQADANQVAPAAKQK